MTLIDKAEALLPCPFCGDQPQFWNAREDVLLCPCLAGPEVHGTSRENAVEIWNRRVIPARGVGVKPETVKDAVMGWVWAEDSDVSKRLGPKHTDALIARILAALAPTDYTLAPHLQKIVDGAKTAPQWDMQADRLAPTDAPDPAPHVNETQNSEHDAGNMLTAALAAYRGEKP